MRVAGFVFCVAFCLGGGVACGGERPLPGGPDVVLITVDTLRADRLGCYGYELDTSPRIDALAAGSVLFERALAGSSATAPSHATIFSSRYTREHSIGFGNGGSRLVEVPTLPRLFLDAGYTTGAFIGNMVLRRGRGFERGFMVFDDELPKPESTRRLAFERTAEQTTQRALAWLDEVGTKPIFLWVHYQDPHGPYAPPLEHKGRFRVPPRPNEPELPILSDNRGLHGIPAYQVLDGMSRPSIYESRYADEIYYADLWIGKLLDALERRATGRGTVVLLTSDHGESLGEDDEYYVHKATRPDVAHVPFLLRAPGLAPARRSEIVHHVDVLPTLLELAGLPIPDGARGTALGPVLRGEGALPSRQVYTDIGDELSAYRGDGFVRVKGVEGAWGQGEDADAPLGPAMLRYLWHPDGSWSVADANEVDLARLADYYRSAVPMRLNPALDAETRERLRALGYLDPEE